MTRIRNCRWSGILLLVAAAFLFVPALASASVTMTMKAYEYDDPPTSDSCPWVFTWNGKEFIKDNDVYSTARGAESEYRDFYLLSKPLLSRDGRYQLQLKEVDKETSYTDQVNLITIDHPRGVHAGIDERGRVWTYKTPSAASTAVDDSGNDILSLIATPDDAGFKAYNNSSIVLDFGAMDLSNGATLVLRAKGFQSDGPAGAEIKTAPRIFVQTEDAMGTWVTRGFFYPRNNWSVNAYDLSSYLTSSKRVRLVATSCNVGKYHIIDYVGMDNSPQEPVQVTSLSPTSAVHSSAGDVLSKVLTSDNIYSVMSTGDYTVLNFDMPELADDSQREFVIMSEGYYIPTGDGTYYIYTWDGSQWQSRASASFYNAESTQQIDLSAWLPDTSGEYKARIFQDYGAYGTVYIDYVGLTVNGVLGAMTYAWDIQNNTNVLTLLSAADNSDLYFAQADNKWVEVRWNIPPTANAGPDQIFEQTRPSGADVVLNGSGSSDPEGEALTYTWTGPFGTATASNPLTTVALPAGTSVVNLTVSDAHGASAPASTTITVRDSTPPAVISPANVTAEATGVLTIVSMGTATATDAVGVVSLTNNAPASFPVGVTNVIWTARDAAGNTGTATQIITVRDTTPPVVTAPANKTVAATLTCTPVSIGTGTATDAVGVVSLTNNAPSCFPVGTSTVVWTARDAVGNTGTAAQTITVTDSVPPTITAPAAKAVPGTGCVTVDLGTPVTWDAIGVASVTNNAPACFPAGFTLVTWTVTDFGGNSATDVQAVSVKEPGAPAVTLTLDATENNEGSCPWVFTWNGSDFVQDNDVYSTAKGQASEFRDFYVLGKPLVTKDGKYELRLKEITEETSYTDQIELLTVDHPAGTSIGVDEKGTISTYRSLAAPASATDDAGNDVLGLIAAEDGTGFKAYNNNSVVLDFSNMDLSNGATLVMRAQGFKSDGAPGDEIKVPPRIYIQTEDGSGNWVTRNFFYPRTDWAKGVYNLSAYLTTSKRVRLLSASCLTGKYHLIDFVGMDNTPQAQVTTTTMLPTMAVHSSNGDVLSAVSSSDDTYSVMNTGEDIHLAFDVPALGDGMTRDFVFLSEGYYIPRGQGTYYIYTMIGSQWAKVASADFLNVVNAQQIDMTPWLPDSGGELKVRIFQDWYISANNIVYIDYVGLTRNGVQVPMVYARNLKNDTDVLSLLNALDGIVMDFGVGGNNWVEVRWNTPPTANPGPSRVVEQTVPAGAMVILDGSLSSDPDGDPLTYTWTGPFTTVTTTNPTASVLMPAGTNTVTLVVNDGHVNSAPVSVIITVRDTIAPVVTPPVNIVTEATGTCTSVSIGTATAADAVGVVPPITNNAPACFSMGTTTVTWSAKDAANNTGTATQTITVRDTTPPVVTPPANIITEATGTCTAVSIGTATATDAVGVVPPITNNAPSCFSMGTTTITWSARDAAGNTGTAAQTITIRDTTPPVITEPVGKSAQGTTCTAVDLQAPYVWDRVGLASVTNNAPSCFPVGITVVTWTATDTSGNSSTALQAVSVWQPGSTPVTMTLEALEGNSCPWVYTWNGTEYVKDNDVYSTARGQQSEYRDFYVLNKPLLPKDGQYVLQLKEIAQETSYTDQIQLVTVDHPAGMSIGVDENGARSTYRSPIAAATAVDGSGNDVSALISAEDGTGFKAYNDSSIVLDFSNLDLSNGATLVLRAKGFQSDGDAGATIQSPPRIFVQTEEGSGNWVTRHFFYPRNDWSKGVYNLSAYLTTSKRVRLLGASCNVGKYHLIDYVGMDNSPQAQVTTTTLLPTSAVHSTGGDVLQKVLTSDNTYAVTNPGEDIQLAFGMPALGDGMIRDFVFQSEGYYTPTPVQGTYYVYTQIGSQWLRVAGDEFVGNWDDPDITRQFDLTPWLPDANGQFKVRIFQDYNVDSSFWARIDYVGLTRNNVPAAMVYAWDLQNNTDVLSILRASDDNSLWFNRGGNNWIEVRWNTAPTANAGPDQVVEQTGPEGANVVLDGSGSSDLEGDPLTYTWSWPSGTITTASPTTTALLSAGTTTVTLVVNDGRSNSAPDEVVITIRDTTPPVVTPPADRTVEATAACTPVDIGMATATDAVGVVPPITKNAPSCFSMGTTTVTWSAKDAANNTGTATQTITVRDTTPPVVTAPPDIVTEATGTLTAISLGMANATDAVGVVTLTNDAPLSFPVGTTLVTWTASDAAGNAGTAVQQVVVRDTTPPCVSLSVNPRADVYHTTDTVAVITEIQDRIGSTPTVSLTLSTNGGDPVTILPGNLSLSNRAGHNVVRLTATDTAGNTNTVVVEFDVL